MYPFTKSPHLTIILKIVIFVFSAQATVRAQFSPPAIHVNEPPSFVVAQKGFSHSLEPFYSTLGDWIDPGAASGRTYSCQLQSGPPGMTLTPEGLMKWIPEMKRVGKSATAVVAIQVLKDGEQISATTQSYHIAVLAELPQLAKIAPSASYESSPLGWNNMIFDGFQPSDEDRARFRWSLISPPPGVYIDALGGLHWPDDRGYSRAEPYIFTVRIDYETANGWLSEEVIYQRRVLPAAATNNYGELRSFNLPPQAAGMLGYSVAAGEGWVVAGEPFPDTSNPGRVRLWKWNEGGNSYVDSLEIQPDFLIGAKSFGTSISIAAANPHEPLRLAVGAPEASQNGSRGKNLTKVGAVHIYSCEANGTWRKDATLSPPAIYKSLEFGASVSIEGDTLVAGMPGMNTAGRDTGALAVFHHGETGWTSSQTLGAEKPARGDRLGEIVDLEGEWIAAGAPGDDDAGNDSGAVHLYRKIAAGYLHQQVIHAPAAEKKARFGERLLMAGPWLFVSSFRQKKQGGAVHVFKVADGVWSYRQTLVSPFQTEGSAFGVSLSYSEGVLAVSAPGYLFNSDTIDGSTAPWKGITLFQLSGDSWEWSKQVTESPDSTPDPHTWGFSLAQVGPGMTITGIPDHSPWVDGEEQFHAGRLFLHRWPALLTDPLPSLLAGLPMIDGHPAGPDDDSNHNGIPNVLDWMMGSDPGSGPDRWTAAVPLSNRPFIRRSAASDETEFMIPELKNGMNRPVDVELSEDLSTWSTVENARWGPLEEVYFKGADGSNHLTYFHPVLIPDDEAGKPVQRFYRCSVREN